MPPPVKPHDHTSFSRGGVLPAYARMASLGEAIGSGTSGGGGGGIVDHGGLSGLADNDHSAYLTVIGGGGGTVQAHGNFGATETIDLSLGNGHWGTLTEACTFTFTAVANLEDCEFWLELIEDGTGGWSPTWPGSVVWLAGTMPVHTTTAATTMVYGFFTRDGGTTWLGGVIGAGSSLTIKDEGTPLATAATSLDFVGAGVVASGATAAKTITIAGPTAADVSALGFVGQLLISDTPSTPLVFADLIQNEAQDDLMYADV